MVQIAWRTSSRVTAYLVEQIPAHAWGAAPDGLPTRTVRALAAHLHNVRCRWIRTLGAAHGVALVRRVDQHRVGRRALLVALRRSDAGISALLRLGCERGGTIPASAAYVWRNLPLDVGHVLAYFVAHEAHHRGQIVMLLRQQGLRLSPAVTAGLWQWQTRQIEATGAHTRRQADRMPSPSDRGTR